MDETHERLKSCFLVVFPDLSGNEISEATSTKVRGWDSVAGVTLLAVVEEEFGINIQVDDLNGFNSFQGFYDYIHIADVGNYEPNGDMSTPQPADLD